MIMWTEIKTSAPPVRTLPLWVWGTEEKCNKLGLSSANFGISCDCLCFKELIIYFNITHQICTLYVCYHWSFSSPVRTGSIWEAVWASLSPRNDFVCNNYIHLSAASYSHNSDFKYSYRLLFIQPGNKSKLSWVEHVVETSFVEGLETQLNLPTISLVSCKLCKEKESCTPLSLLIQFHVCVSLLCSSSLSTADQLNILIVLWFSAVWSSREN